MSDRLVGIPTLFPGSDWSDMHPGAVSSVWMPAADSVEPFPDPRYSAGQLLQAEACVLHFGPWKKILLALPGVIIIHFR